MKINLNNALKSLEGISDAAEVEEEPSVDVLKDRILLRGGTGVQSIDINDLLFLEADGDTTKVHTSVLDHPMVASTHLKDFLEKLAGMSKDMIRVNRSNAVNIKKIVEIKDDFHNLSAKKTIILSDTERTVALSPIYKKELMARFKLI